MTIFTDTSQTQFGMETTPAHTHMFVQNWGDVLADLENGVIPSYTLKPFPVNWKEQGKDPIPFHGPYTQGVRTNHSPFLQTPTQYQQY